MNQYSLFEFHASWGGKTGPKSEELARIMSNKDMDVFSKAELLASALPTSFKELGRLHYQSLFLDEDRFNANAYIDSEIKRLQSLDLQPSISRAMSVLPEYSLGVEFDFELSKPYLSRDDDAFYIIDNPVRKDKVFKIPFISPSSWKGCLRFACVILFIEKAISSLGPSSFTNEKEFEIWLINSIWPLRVQTILLFGNEKTLETEFIETIIHEKLFPESLKKDQDKKQIKDKKIRWRNLFERYLIESGYRTEKIEGRMGRLHFFPTFFNRIGLEIINPHDRKTKTGKNPILMECVPAGATGKFRLLYVPFDFLDDAPQGNKYVTYNESALKMQLSNDIPMVARTIQKALTAHGFGAKTSSGFGTAKDSLLGPGRIFIKADLKICVEQSIRPKSLEYLFEKEDNIQDFIGSDKKLITKEQYQESLNKKNVQFTRKKKKLYNAVKNWWDDKGKYLFEQQIPEKKGSEDTQPPQLFSMLSNLPETAAQICEALNNGGEI